MSDTNNGNDQTVAAAPTPGSWSLYLGVALVAATILFLELVFFQIEVYLADYLQASQVIAVALLGISAGGIFAAVFRNRLREKIALIGAFGMPIGIVIAFFVCLRFPDLPIAQELTIMLPFMFGSMILSYQIAAHPSHKVYFADLIGAGAGVMFVIFLLPPLREEGSIFFAVAVSAFTAYYFVSRESRNLSQKTAKLLRIGALALCAIFVAVLIVQLAADVINMATDVYPTPDNKILRNKIWNRIYKQKQAQQKAEDKGKTYKGELLTLQHSKGSLIERIDILKRKTKKNYILTAFNGYTNDHMGSAKIESHTFDIRMPTNLTPDAAVLVIGTAAEGVMKPAVLANRPGNKPLVGLEINPPLVDIMAGPYYKFTKKVIDHFDMYVMDARSYLKQTDLKFDIITAMNTHRIRNIGSIGPPEYLHTIEAFRSYFDHLTDRGWISFEERNKGQRADIGIARLLVTAKYTMEKYYGVKDFAKHVIVYYWYGGDKKGNSKYTQIMIKKTPWTADELQWMEYYKERRVPRKSNGELRDSRPRRTVSWVAFPKQGKQYNQKKNLYYEAIHVADINTVLPADTYNMTPITDNRPFPYDVFNNREQHVTLIERCVTYAGVIVLLPVIIFMIITFGSGREKRPGSFLVYQLYFALLGLAYLMIEIVLMQRFQMYLNSPIYSIAVVLGSMLVTSGLGSLVAGRFSNKNFVIAFLAIFAMLGIMVFVAPAIIENTVRFPLIIRILISIILVGTLGFLMGMPFPMGLNRLKGQWSDRMAALSFGVNGAFGAIATPLAMLTNKAYDFSFTFGLGAACYLAALIVFVVLIATGRAKQTTEQTERIPQLTVSVESLDATPEESATHPAP